MAATVDQGTLDSAPAAVGDELGDGPFARAENEPAKTMDAAPATSDVPEASAEAEMIETDSMQDRTDPATDGAWPTVDRAAEVEDATVSSDAANGADDTFPEIAPERLAAAATETRSRGKRDNPIVAGLVKAMREAAVASRSETTTRLQAEAAARIESIRAESTEEAAALRKRVDDDIAEIREWSKVEMARIKAETEHRIEERRADAINESQRHLDSVEELVQRVQATVTAFEADMDRFFDRLLAENDPARLAALAEQAPDAPDLTGELPKATGWTARVEESAQAEPEGFDGVIGVDTSDAQAEASDETVAEASVETVPDAPAETFAEAAAETDVESPTETVAEASMETVGEAADETAAEPVVLEAAAAAEAEAAASEGLDLSAGDEWPATVMAAMAAAARRDDKPAEPAEDSATTRLHVSGLTSVAGISAFKGAIGGLTGVRSVSVSTGERGVFIYSVNHDQDLALATALAGLSAFAVDVAESGGDHLSVTAHEPA